jgi:NAD(P)H-hydrate epimerase
MRYPIDKNITKSVIKKRPSDADKTTIGTLLSVCGSYGMAGAAVMSAKSALRSGIGLLKLALPDSIYPICAQSVPEAVFIPLKNIAEFDFEKSVRYCSAVLCGCGLGVSDYGRKAVHNVLYYSEVPMIFDADALNIIAEDTDILAEAKSDVILTPHNREFARLLGCHPEMLKSKREELASKFAQRNNVILVLKGSKTIVASPKGDILYNEELGNPGMACGGSGDVLAGIIASLTAQGGDPFRCAAAGVYIHALAGDIAAKKFGEISMLPTDIIDCLPEAFKSI